MNGFDRERGHMVRHQLARQGIHDPRVQEAMAEIPRHLYLDPERWFEAYEPRAVPIAAGQTISQPYMVALMTQLLELSGNERVLEVGTGSGYQTAVLARLAGVVYSIERIEPLARSAHRLLGDQGYDNVHVLVGDGTRGWPEEGPYDRVIVTAAAPQVPASLLEQLADPGILVCPVGDRDMQMLEVVHRKNDSDLSERVCACRFVPLVGEEGFDG